MVSYHIFPTIVGKKNITQFVFIIWFLLLNHFKMLFAIMLVIINISEIIGRILKTCLQATWVVSGMAGKKDWGKAWGRTGGKAWERTGEKGWGRTGGKAWERTGEKGWGRTGGKAWGRNRRPRKRKLFCNLPKIAHVM